MNSITPQNAQVELETGKALMIDLREPMDFEFVSFDIDGVVNIPARKLPDAIHKFQKAKRLICADFDETLAPKAAMMLEYHGFINVVYLEGGMKNWNREHLPLKYNVEGGCDDSDCHSCSGCGH
jgi:rhodanese-related sulfurtransferase